MTEPILPKKGGLWARLFTMSSDQDGNARAAESAPRADGEAEPMALPDSLPAGKDPPLPPPVDAPPALHEVAPVSPGQAPGEPAAERLAPAPEFPVDLEID